MAQQWSISLKAQSAALRIVVRPGISFSRWSTEATTMEEFRQYPHYMQPRIHKMMQEVCPVHIALSAWPAPMFV